MSSATYALGLLLVSGAVGILGLWQLLAGSSHKAKLAERGQAGVVESTGRSVIRALDIRFRRTGNGRRLASWLAGGGVRLSPIELIALLVASSLLAWLVLGLLLARPFAFVAS